MPIYPRGNFGRVDPKVAHFSRKDPPVARGVDRAETVMPTEYRSPLKHCHWPYKVFEVMPRALSLRIAWRMIVYEEQN